MNKLSLIVTVILLSICSNSFFFAKDNLGKAKQLVKDKKLTEAIILLEEIIEDNESNAEAYFVLGKVNMELKEFGDASDSFEEAVELENDNSEYHYWLGRAYGADARESNIFSKAILAPKIKSQFEIAVQLDSNNVGARNGLAQYYLQAPGIAGGDVDKAIEHANIIIKSDEQNGRMILANAYMQKEQFDLAEEQYRLLLDKFGNEKKYSSIYNAYGYMLLNQNKLDAAIQAFQKQVELAPENANSYDSLGDGYRKAGKLELALVQYKKALEIDPQFESSKNNIEEIEDELEK